jgi:pimeloyl-ACP methyl ester carboxylesterase
MADPLPSSGGPAGRRAGRRRSPGGGSTPSDAAGTHRVEYGPLPPPSWTDLDGPVHYLDFGGPADGPLMVLVHGLGGSALNWAAIAPTLAREHRVMAIDLAGFGRTRGRGRSSAVDANQRLLHRFLTEVSGSPAIVVGNSMGGLITILQANRYPDTLAAAVLVDPALPVGPSAPPHPLVGMAFTAYTVPAVGRRVLRARRSFRSAEQAARDVLRLCCADVGRVPAEIVEHHLDLARDRHDDPDVDGELITAARSLIWVLARRGRYRELMRQIRVPVLLLHGDQDRLVPIAAARAAASDNPSWRFAVAEGVGHVPQLEVPDWTVAQITDWLAAEAADARELAREATLG